MPNAARDRKAQFPIAYEAFHALVDVTKSLLRPMNLTAVLDQILTQVEKLFGYEICSVILPTGTDDRLYMAAHRGYDPAIANTIRIRIGKEGIIGHVAATGKPHYALQRLAVPDVFASPVGAAGRVYIPGRDGAVVVLKHGATFEQLGVNKLDDGFDASPALVDGEIFMRGYKNLYCIAEK